MPDLAEQIRGFIDSGATPVTAQEVVEARRASASPAMGRARYLRPRRMNTYAIGAAAMATAICVLVVVLVFGLGLASTSKTKVSNPQPTGIPTSWQKVTFGGLTMYAPGNWPTKSETIWNPCDLTWFYPSGIIALNTGTQVAPPIGCPDVLPPAPLSGLLIDPGPNGPAIAASDTGCLHINGLTVCPTSAENSARGPAFLDLAVHIPGRSQPVAVEIGLAGGGKVAHAIEYSMRAAGSKPTIPPTTPTTTKANLGQWPTRTIANTGEAQDIVPTSHGTYWLSLNGPASGTPSAVAPGRYYAGNTEVGPSINGLVSSSAIAVTGGWVWVAVGVGNDVVIEQFDPLTLVLHSKYSFTVKNTFAGSSLDPVLTATDGGPLWVAGERDLWELSPSSGAVETEIDTNIDIGSMSTDPTGSILYAGGQASRTPVVVAEYDVHTGKELAQANLEGPGGVTVAGTVGGVWVGWRTGNSGQITELTAVGLRDLATTGGLTNDTWLVPFETGGAVYLGVSNGALWVSTIHTTGALMCGNPITGLMRSTEATNEFVDDPTAYGGKLYAFGDTGLVTITPPAACFG